MSRPPAVSYVDYNDEEDKIFCPFCESVGLKNKLGVRVYDDEKDIPVDNDNYLQCYKCGAIIPIYEAKETGEYGPIVDMIENPFDAGSEFKGVEKRSNKKKKRRPKDKLNKDDVFAKDMQAEKGEINILYDSAGNY